MLEFGREFYKMSGSGNDFVFVDARREAPGRLAEPAVIDAICQRGTGVGADGIVFLESSQSAVARMTYLNRDGSRADLCGNASLCAARLLIELGSTDGRKEFGIESDSGTLRARQLGDRIEVDLQPVTDVQPDAGIATEEGEERMGFALVGVPHLVVLSSSISHIDVLGRGRQLRRHHSLRQGANINFVARHADGRWAVRTYERGVEAETLACGTGAVATAVLLTAWQCASGPVTIVTRSGRELRVRLTPTSTGLVPSLSGEARIVYRGRLGEVSGF